MRCCRNLIANFTNMKFITRLFFLLLVYSANAQSHQYLLVGTYTSGKSEGIYVYDFNSATGDVSPVSKIKSSNPSYLAIAPGGKNVYAVYEDGNNQVGGSVAAFSFNHQTGQLTYLNQQLSGGDHPCYVAVDKTGKWVVAGNYTGGSVAVFPIEKDGSVGKEVSKIQHKGSSVNKERQEKAHVHCTYFSPDNHFLFVPDLGMDKVMIYAFNDKTGKLTPAAQPFYKATDGAGPRHFDIAPNHQYAYLMEEMGSSVVAFKYASGKLSPIQTISSAPKGVTGDLGSADIHVSPDGKFLYCSNRGESNTIAIFKINAATGKLKMVGTESTQGKTPRNFNFDPSGNYLLVANQNSDNIVIFKRDKQTGLLTPTGKQIEVGKPVCLKWILN